MTWQTAVDGGFPQWTFETTGAGYLDQSVEFDLGTYNPAIAGEGITRTAIGYRFLKDWARILTQHQFSSIVTDIIVERRVDGRMIGGVSKTSTEVTLDRRNTNLYASDIAATEDEYFVGSPGTIYVGDPAEPLTSAKIVAKGVVSQQLVDPDVARLNLRDDLPELSQPPLTETYKGNGGLNGSAELKGKTKPILYGKAFNVTPILISGPDLIYQVASHAITDVQKVFDNGVELTRGSDYTDQDDMLSNPPASGEYRVLLSDGMFRLGSTPAGTITANVNNANINTVPAIIQDLLTRAGVSVNTAAFSNVETNFLPWLAGLWISDNRKTIFDLVNEGATNHNLIIWKNENDVFTVNWIKNPDSDAALKTQSWDHQITDTDVYDGSFESPSDELSPIVWSVDINYRKNYTLQTTLAAGASSDQQIFAASPGRTVQIKDNSLLTIFPSARSLEIDSWIYNDEDVSAFAQSLLNLWGPSKFARRIYRLSLYMTSTTISYNLGDTIRYNSSVMAPDALQFQYGLIIGLRINAIRRRVDISVLF